MNRKSTSRQKAISKKFDKTSLLRSKKPDLDFDIFFRAIRLSSPYTIAKIIAQKTGYYTAEQGLMLLKQCESDLPFFTRILEKSKIDDELVNYVIHSRNHKGLEHLCRRRELSANNISQILNMEDVSTYMRPTIVKNIIAHAKCSQIHLRKIWDIWGEDYRTYVLSAKNVPVDLQEAVSKGKFFESTSLIGNPKSKKDLRKHHTKVLISNGDELFLENAITDGLFMRGEIAAMSQDADLRKARYASDRLSEETSLVRVSEYTKFHVGFHSSQINSLISSYLELGLPLGWFVCAAFYLRKIFPNDAKKFHQALVNISNQNMAYKISNIAYCSEKEIAHFGEILSLIPSRNLPQIILNSIERNTLSVSNIIEISRLARKSDIGDVLSRLRWSRILNSEDLVFEVRHDLLSRHFKNYLVKPSKKPYWAWAQHLDGKALDSDREMLVLKSAKQIRDVGLNFRNCLANDAHFLHVIEGQSVLIGIKENASMKYLAEIRAFDRRILQFKGKYNQPVAEHIRTSFENFLKSSIDLAESQKPHKTVPI